MKLIFVYSKAYNDFLNRAKPVSTEWSDIVKTGKAFEKKYAKEITKILGLLPKLLDSKWKYPVKEVFIVDWNGPSFAPPLTLKIRRDLLLMLVMLTHELTHYFFKGFIDSTEKHKKINDAVEEVFRKLKINAKPQIAVMRGFTEH